MFNNLRSFLRTSFGRMDVKVKNWDPWRVSPQNLWDTRHENREPCDPVTCSECPGGERCCNFTPQGE